MELPEPSTIWRLHVELSVLQAAYLILNVDPKIERDLDQHPDGYFALEEAIARALKAEVLNGRIEPKLKRQSWLDDHEPATALSGTVDERRSVVDVASLKKWLSDNGMSPKFFFPAGSPMLGFMDPGNGRYAPKLAAAFAAWQALNGVTVPAGKTAKQLINNWLTKNADEYELVENGKPNAYTIEEIAKVVNWDQRGGAPTKASKGTHR